MKKQTSFCVSSHVGGKETLTDGKIQGKSHEGGNRSSPLVRRPGCTGLEGFVHILRFFLLLAAVQRKGYTWKSKRHTDFPPNHEDGRQQARREKDGGPGQKRRDQAQTLLSVFCALC